MAETDPRKAARLVAFRKLERERASREVHAARAQVVSAQQAVETQEQVIEKETSNIPTGDGRSVHPEEMSLALACVEAARNELTNKVGFLKNAEQQLGVQSAKLLLVHKKVRQMEALKAQAEEMRNKAARNKETREIEDLAQNREARK